MENFKMFFTLGKKQVPFLWNQKWWLLRKPPFGTFAFKSEQDWHPGAHPGGFCGLRQCFPTRFGRLLPPIIKQLCQILNVHCSGTGKHWFKAQLQQAGRTGI